MIIVSKIVPFNKANFMVQSIIIVILIIIIIKSDIGKYVTVFVITNQIKQYNLFFKIKTCLKMNTGERLVFTLAINVIPLTVSD